MINIVTYTNLYPSTVLPRHGIFVEERLRQLLETGEVNAEVIVPVPWFPFESAMFGRYSEYASIPASERRLDRCVRYPKYPVIPKIGMSLAPFLMAAWTVSAVRAAVTRLSGNVVIDGHFLYPDGVAAAIVARHLGLPYILTARGQDVTLFPNYRIPRHLILWAASGSARVITVSEALRSYLLELGVDADKVLTLRNGVDAARFAPVDRVSARQRLHLSGPTLLAVGHLIERKNHKMAIDALAQLPDMNLVIIGSGPLHDQLVQQAVAQGVADRLRIEPIVSQAELTQWYSAADLMLLTSYHEGMPNVVLESLACGTPVISTPVEGVAELLTDSAAGTLLSGWNLSELVDAIRRSVTAPPDRHLTRQHGQQLGWGQTTDGLLKVLRDAAGSSES